MEAGIEVQSNGTDQGKKVRNSCCLACSSIDAPETAVLVAIRNMNVHQYDRSHFLDPYVLSSQVTGRTLSLFAATTLR